MSERRITGRHAHLDGPDGKRGVWLGQLDDGMFAVLFINAEGEETRLKLSEEALQALTHLHEAEKVWPAAEFRQVYTIASYAEGVEPAEPGKWSISYEMLPPEVKA